MKEVFLFLYPPNILGYFRLNVDFQEFQMYRYNQICLDKETYGRYKI